MRQKAFKSKLVHLLYYDDDISPKKDQSIETGIKENAKKNRRRRHRHRHKMNHHKSQLGLEERNE